MSSTAVLSPATGEAIGSVSWTPPEDVAGIVEEVARVQVLWALLRVEDRARYMRRAAQAVIDEFSDLSRLLAQEVGRPPAEGAFTELLPAVDALRFTADAGPRLLADHRVAPHRSIFPLKRARVGYEPLGVVAVIGSAGAPLALPLGQVAQALVAGNGVVLKPSRGACLLGQRIGGLMARAGLPEGLVAVVQGSEAVGRALVAAPVDKVFFTGHPAAGQEVARVAAQSGREVVREQGGQDAMLVLADAPLARTIAGACWAGFSGAGRPRGSVERLFVVEEVAEAFTEGLVRGAEALRVGDPLAGDVDVGPLGSERRLAHVQSLVSDAVSAGAVAHCGGQVHPAGLDGNFWAPTVVGGVRPDMRILREPIGGPVVAVVSVESTAQAIELANRSELGLGASVWSEDRHQALRIARELRAGMVWINDHLVGPMVPQGPWGGVRGSGQRRSLGEDGLRECATPKLVSWDPPAGRAPWWFAYEATVERAARAVAELRSARDSDRQRALREGTLPIARLLGRSLREARARRDPGRRA
ncbi:MAG TPA: aldehyde dehydrogenase family protein [Solirubrobacteraceae bacterium]|nr:aldehyde dehydrogenase family protein [Solirubrobacteraceae bacterium]